LKEKDLSLKKY